MGLFQFCSPRTIKNIDRPNKFYIYRSLDKMEHIKNYLDGLCHISYSEFFNDPFDTSFAEQFSVSWFSKYPALRMFDIVMRYLFIGDRRKEILKEKFAQVVDTNKELSFKEVFAIINSLLPYNERYDIEEACASIEKYINERNPVFSMPYKVACFGSRYDSILMWAYYGGAHKGICIEYDFSLINQSFWNENIKKNAIHFHLVFK